MFVQENLCFTVFLNQLLSMLLPNRILSLPLQNVVSFLLIYYKLHLDSKKKPKDLRLLFPKSYSLSPTLLLLLKQFDVSILTFEQILHELRQRSYSL